MLSALIMLAYNLIRVLTPCKFLEDLARPLVKDAFYLLGGLGL